MFSALQSTSCPVTDFENRVQINSDAIQKNRNIGAQLQSILYTSAQKRFRKIYFLYDFWTFWCAQTCSFRAVFGLLLRNLTLAVSARWRRAAKVLYKCTSTYSALNYCVGIFFQIPQLSIRSGAHKLFRRFLNFSQFLTAI